MAKTRPQKIRQTVTPAHRVDRLSREQALQRVCARLKEHPGHPEALYLIGLFRLDAEELCEAGLPYELVKALERRASFF